MGGRRIQAECLWFGAEEFGGWFCNLGQKTDGLVDAVADVAVAACCAAAETRVPSLGTPFFTWVSEFGV